MRQRFELVRREERRLKRLATADRRAKRFISGVVKIELHEKHPDSSRSQRSIRTRDVTLITLIILRREINQVSLVDETSNRAPWSHA